MQTVCCIILGGQIGDRGRLQFTGSASALVSASEQAPRAPRLYAVLSWRSRERGAVGSPLAGASRVKGGACGCRSPEEWSVAEILGGHTSGALTLRRARAAQSAVCTRLLVSVQARARPEPCVARGRPRVLCVRVSVQAHPQHFRRSHHNHPCHHLGMLCAESAVIYEITPNADRVLYHPGGPDRR